MYLRSAYFFRASLPVNRAFLSVQHDESAGGLQSSSTRVVQNKSSNQQNYWVRLHEWLNYCWTWPYQWFFRQNELVSDIQLVLADEPVPEDIRWRVVVRLQVLECNWDSWLHALVDPVLRVETSLWQSHVNVIHVIQGPQPGHHRKVYSPKQSQYQCLARLSIR